MNIKKYLITFFAIITLVFPTKSYAQNPYDNISCLGWCILVPAYIITSWMEEIGDLVDDISDSRTVSIKISGVKCVFRRNSVVYNENKKNKIISGEIVEKAEVIIRGKELKILPGKIIFYENGNIASCLISSSELYIGDNSIVRCSDSVEFYDDEFVKSTTLFEYSVKDDEVFNIQGKGRKLTGGISFFKSGRVEKCRVKSGEFFNIADYTAEIPGDTNLQFLENGDLIYIKPKYETTVNLKYKNNFLKLTSDIVLHENGKLKYCTVDEPLIVQNALNKLKVRGMISFYDNEMIEECRITNPVSIDINKNVLEFDKLEERESSPLSFYINGNLKYGRISKNKKQNYIHKGNQIKLSEATSVECYKDGSLKSLVPVKDTILNIGNERFVLYNNAVRFYNDGSVLSLYSTNDTEYNFQGTKLYVNSYSEKIFFNRKQELIIFNNDNGGYLQVNGKSVFVPPYTKVSYLDYDKKIVEYFGINYKQLTLPPNVRIIDTEYIKYADIFVKAENFFNNKSKDKLYANDVREIMFSEDTMMIVDGKEYICEAMEWFKIPIE